jgi:hypothetical protein
MSQRGARLNHEQIGLRMRGPVNLKVNGTVAPHRGPCA